MARPRVAALCLLLAGSAGAEISEPTSGGWRLQGSVDAMAGQYFFNGQAGSLNGYGAGALQLLRPVSSDSGFYLDARGAYTGFKQVNELAGGGTLFQQSADASLGVKWVKRFEGGWSLKPRLGVRGQLFRETKDEDWGKGLYDFRRYEAGVLLERRTRLGLSIPWTWQVSYDLYHTRYPNFRSLASQFGLEQTATSPGSRLLDTLAHQLAYRAEADLPGFVSLWGLYSISFVGFTDQRVVQSQGQFLSTRRSDVYQSLNLGGSKRFDDLPLLGGVRPVAAVNVTLADLLSNQNHFDTDPSRLRFIGAYYDFWEARLAPSASLLFLATRTSVRFGLEGATRRFTGRLAQNSDGSYKGDKLAQWSESAWLEAAHPVWRGLEAKVRMAWSNTASNTAFERTYQYNYHDATYFAGFGWRF